MRWCEKCVVVYMFVMVLVSCKKNTGNEVGPAINLPALPEKNTWIAGATREVANILEQVYRDRKAFNEVNAAIYSGYYEDERVLLKDLLFPDKSELYQSAAFKKFGSDTGVFKKRFFEVLDTGNFPIAKAQLVALTFYNPPSTVSVSDNFRIVTPYPSPVTDITGLSIYFPYSENFNSGSGEIINNKLDLIQSATIVPTDREADSAPGRKPASCTAGANSICYNDVIVDDPFAVTNPTHIVAVGAVLAGIPPAEPAVSASMVRIYNGWSRLTKQMDKLISLTGNGGGSEIKLGRVSGYLKTTDQQVTGFSGDVMTVYFTRSDIRNKKWKRVFGTWDPNWDVSNLEQVYAVYEDDTQGSKTLSGSVNTSLTLPGKPSLGKVTGEIGFKVEVVTQDEIITQRKLERTSFLRDGMSNQGWGTIADANDFLPLNKDWPVYDGGTVWQYTMAWKYY